MALYRSAGEAHTTSRPLLGNHKLSGWLARTGPEKAGTGEADDGERKWRKGKKEFGFGGREETCLLNDYVVDVKISHPAFRGGLAASPQECGQQTASRCQPGGCLCCRSCLANELAFPRAATSGGWGRRGYKGPAILVPRGTTQMGGAPSRLPRLAEALGGLQLISLCPVLLPSLSAHRSWSLITVLHPSCVSASENPTCNGLDLIILYILHTLSFLNCTIVWYKNY